LSLTIAPIAPGIAEASPVLAAAYAKITRRLVPWLFLCYLMNFIDRANIGFAQLQMKTSLGFSDAVYGLGAAMFFVGYAIFEVPSNLLLKRVGARKTILRIMVLWGLASTATLFVRTPMQFYIVRFLLGVFEAGFLPGIILYLTFWFPSDRRARVLALILTAQVAAAFVTSPVSGWILKNMHGLHGWEGWQWMFLIEGLPTVALGVAVYFVLSNGPADAKWLTPDEAAQVQAAVRQHSRDDQHGHSFSLVWKDPRVYLLAFGQFVMGCGGYFLAFWTPTIIREHGIGDLQQVGLYAVIPNFFGILAMVYWGRRSDRHKEQRVHYGLTFVATALGFLALSWTIRMDLYWTLAAIVAGGSGVVAATPVFWALATRYLSKEAAPAGIAYISTLAAFAGLTPALVGMVKTRTGSFDAVLYAMAAMSIVAGIAITLLMRKPMQERGAAA